MPSMMMMISDSCMSAPSSGEGEGVPRGSMDPMENLPVAIPPTTVVEDRLVEELGVLGVILKKDDKEEC
jgi:hypothetical protein